MSVTNSKTGEGSAPVGVFIPSSFSLLSLQALPTFRGLDSGLSVEEFIERIEDSAAQWQWTPSEKYFALKDRLFGEARACINEFGEEISDFITLKDRLIKLFGKKINPSNALFEFMAFKQPMDMPVERYFAQAVQKSKFLDFGQCDHATKELQRKNMLLSMFKLNLQPQILRGVLAKNPQSLDDLKRLAILEEKAWVAVRANNNPFLQPQPEVFKIEQNNESKLADLCATLTSQVETLSKKIDNLELEVANKQRRSSTVGPCYNCGKMGHIQRFCRSRQQRNNGYARSTVEPRENQGN